MVPILKYKQDASQWPYILEKPFDDTSFYPFDNAGIRRAITGLVFGWFGIGFVLSVIAAVILTILGMA